MKPFLKWAGGKYRLVERIRSRLPEGRRLVEPFVGSGAVWLNTDYAEALLVDINPDLITLYRTLQVHGEEFIRYCAQFFSPAYNTAEGYYQLRDRFNQTADPWERSGLFLYLNRHGYNGLCRYNASGGFNVPFGRYRQPYFPFDEMRYFHKKAQSAIFLCDDFRTAMQSLDPGDVVYCDPPYVPLSDTANFTDYAKDGFSHKDQADLASMAEVLGRRGIPVLVSNHATPFTLEAYQGAEIDCFDVQRFISCKGENRRPAAEVLALFR